MDISKLNLQPISEDEVVFVFLKGELKSKRFSQDIVNAIKKLNGDENLVLNPDLSKSEENILRKEILEETRKYISREGLFEGLPNNIKWYRVEFPSDFLINEVKYIDYDYWIELTNGSRLPKDAIKKIQTNKMIFNVPYDNFIEASEQFKKNKSFDEIILVSDGKQFVVLEGHLRLTVYALNRDILPESLSLIIGFSDKMKDWSNF